MSVLKFPEEKGDGGWIKVYLERIAETGIYGDDKQLQQSVEKEALSLLEQALERFRKRPRYIMPLIQNEKQRKIAEINVNRHCNNFSVKLLAGFIYIFVEQEIKVCKMKEELMKLKEPE